VTEYAPAKTDKYPLQVIFPIFKTMSVAENIWRIINTISSIWRENMLGYLSLDIASSQLCSWKTVCFSEQIMCADKYPSIFLRQMEAIAYLSLSRTFPKRNTSKLWQLDKILGWTKKCVDKQNERHCYPRLMYHT